MYSYLTNTFCVYLAPFTFRVLNHFTFYLSFIILLYDISLSPPFFLSVSYFLHIAFYPILSFPVRFFMAQPAEPEKPGIVEIRTAGKRRRFKYW
jgi:hypothetical protein